MKEPTPYGQWPQDKRSREQIVQDWFGRDLMAHARDLAWKKIPSTASEEARELAKKAALDALHGVLQILDGTTGDAIDPERAVEFLLLGRVVQTHDGGRDEILEEHEIGPGGEGLTNAFPRWIKDNFGDA